MLKKLNYLILLAALSTSSWGFSIKIDTALTGKRHRTFSTLLGKYWVAAKERGGEDSMLNPLKLGDPVHESITLDALNIAGFDMDLEFPSKDGDKKVLAKDEVLIGLLFNDDPDGFLFPKTDFNPKGYQLSENGFKWLLMFGKVEAAKLILDDKLKDLMKYRLKLREMISENTESIFDLTQTFVYEQLKKTVSFLETQLKEERAELNDNILFASHYGDLQYLHGMASSTDSREKVKAKIMGYSKHAWKTATGELTFAQQSQRYNNERKMDQKSLEGGAKFRSRFAFTDLVFHTEEQKILEFRALGSLLHLVQDSYAKGHVVREGWEDETNSGDVRYFQNYAQQDGTKHGQYDSNTENPENWQAIPGAAMATKRSAEIVSFFLNKCSWEGDISEGGFCPENGVKGYLEKEVFGFSQEEKNGMTRSHPLVRK